MPDTRQETFSGIVDGIAEKGWSATEMFLPSPTLDLMIAEEKALWEEGRFRQAGVGVGANRIIRSEVRTDRVLWLDPDSLPSGVREYWQTIEALRQQLNREFFLGLRDFEAHFAVYPPGSFYKRHLDQFKEVSNRLISCILYVNRDWKEEDGGLLRIYEGVGEGETCTDIVPSYGTFVCFRSDLIYHEVLPAHRERFSLTGWLRTT